MVTSAIADKTLYIRNFPKELHIKLKTEASQRGITLQELVIEILEDWFTEETETESQAQPMPITEDKDIWRIRNVRETTKREIQVIAAKEGLSISETLELLVRFWLDNH